MKNLRFTFFSAALILVGFLGSIPAQAGSHFSVGICKWLLAGEGWKEAATSRDSLDGVEWVRDRRQLDGVTDVLAEAFKGDSLWNWFHPDPKVQRQLMSTFVNHAFIDGGILQVVGGKTGAALWFDAKKGRIGPLSFFTSGSVWMLPTFGTRSRDLLKFDDMAEQKREEVVQRYCPDSGPAIYLQVIGVVPAERGKHWATKLLSPVLSRADREGRSVVLELQNPNNAALYEHFGFVGAREWTMPADAPKTTTMVRLPKSN